MPENLFLSSLIVVKRERDEFEDEVIDQLVKVGRNMNKAAPEFARIQHMILFEYKDDQLNIVKALWLKDLDEKVKVEVDQKSIELKQIFKTMYGISLSMRFIQPANSKLNFEKQ